MAEAPRQPIGELSNSSEPRRWQPLEPLDIDRPENGGVARDPGNPSEPGEWQPLDRDRPEEDENGEDGSGEEDTDTSDKKRAWKEISPLSEPSEEETAETDRLIAAHQSAFVRAKILRAFEEVRVLFRSKGEALDSDTAEKLVTENPPKHPSFPFFILTVAIVKDALDLPLDLTGVGIVVATILGLVLSLILTIWTWNRLSGGWWKKKIITWMWMSLGAVVVIEIVPGLQIVPANTIFILMAHYKEKKLVQLFDAALEHLKKADVLKYIS